MRGTGREPTRRRIWGICALALPAALLLPSAASAATATFDYNGTTGSDGSAQQWVVPAGVTSATFDLYGAQGGTGSGPSFTPRAPGGLGAHLRATIAVSPGQTLQIFVGGGPVPPNPNLLSGGFNGGGTASAALTTPQPSGGGGGASDVRTGPALSDRVLIAAGGGGGGGNGVGPDPNLGGGPPGGAGGDSGASGVDGTDFDATTLGGGGGGPGGPAAPGTAGSGGDGIDADGQDGNPGSEGEGGDAVESSFGGDGGGGGGGLYGGGSGGGGGTIFSPARGGGGAGGGGGSSFATATATGVVLLDGVHSGPGQVVITYADPPAVSPTVSPSPRITQKPKRRGRGDGKKKGNKKRYVFHFEDDVPGVSFFCRIDEKPFEPCTSPAIYEKRQLKTGRHTFAVKSVTAAGVESAPQTTSFRVRRPRR